MKELKEKLLVILTDQRFWDSCSDENTADTIIKKVEEHYQDKIEWYQSENDYLRQLVEDAQIDLMLAQEDFYRPQTIRLKTPSKRGDKIINV